MRQVQRMQTGMALVALLFCLTSTASWAKQTQASSAAHHQQTFGEANPGALSSADRLSIYPTQGKHIGDPWTVTRESVEKSKADTMTAFQVFQSALDSAVVSDMHPQDTTYSLLFFGRGQLQRFLAITQGGIVYDPASNQWYRVNPLAIHQLQSHWQKRSTGE